MIAAAGTVRRRFIRPTAVLAVAIGLAAAFQAVSTLGGADLRVYYDAGWNALHGSSLYAGIGRDDGGLLPLGTDEMIAPADGARLPFTYPPFAGLPAVGIGLLPWQAARLAWTAVSVLALAATVAMSHRALLSGRRHRTAWVLAVTAAWMFAGPVSDHLGFGQVGLILMAACLADAALPPRSFRFVPQGVATGISGAVKLVPVAYLAVPILQRRWRVAAWGAAAFLGCALLGFALLPADTLDYFGSLLPGLGDRVAVGMPDSTGNQSIRGLLLRELPAGTPGVVLTSVWLASAAVVMTVALPASARAARARGGPAGLVVLALAVQTVLPVAWTHHYVWLVPAVGMLCTPAAGRAATGPWERAAVAVVLAAVFGRITALTSTYAPDIPVIGALGTNSVLVAAIAAILALGAPGRNTKCGSDRPGAVPPRTRRPRHAAGSAPLAPRRPRVAWENAAVSGRRAGPRAGPRGHAARFPSPPRSDTPPARPGR